MLEELSEDLNSIKMIQSETKDTLIEIATTNCDDFNMSNSRIIESQKENRKIKKLEI